MYSSTIVKKKKKKKKKKKRKIVSIFLGDNVITTNSSLPYNPWVNAEYIYQTFSFKVSFLVSDNVFFFTDILQLFKSR